jgi:phosphatidylserine/phosphatidylglycerophosphate/cardiolipin synthase-like enzyme
VVNQQIAMLTNDTPPAKGVKPPAELMDPAAATNSVALFTSGNQPPQRLDHDVLVPSNIKSQFHDWEKELLGASLVNIHSKVIVIDPFGEHPVVMTGSHNLGYKASSENDDNLAIIEGNAPLAAAYAINIIAIYQTYRWNSHVEQHRKDASFWHGLQDSDKWQTGYLSGEHLAEIRFFMGETETSVAGILPERTYPIHAVSTARAPKKKHAVT